jgi:hypothetical protein
MKSLILLSTILFLTVQRDQVPSYAQYHHWCVGHEVACQRQVTACQRICSRLELHSQGHAGAGTSRRGAVVCRRRPEATKLGQHAPQWVLFVTMTTVPLPVVPSTFGRWEKTLFSVGFGVKFICAWSWSQVVLKLANQIHL